MIFLLNSDCRSPNEGKGSRSEAEDCGSKSRVDRARRKTAGPILKPATSVQQTKNPSHLSRPSSTPAEPMVETAEAALVPDLPEGRTLLEVRIPPCGIFSSFKLFWCWLLTKGQGFSSRAFSDDSAATSWRSLRNVFHRKSVLQGLALCELHQVKF